MSYKIDQSVALISVRSSLDNKVIGKPRLTAVIDTSSQKIIGMAVCLRRPGLLARILDWVHVRFGDDRR